MNLALCSALTLPAGSAPAWLHLLPAGDVRAVDGRGPYRIGDTRALFATSMASGKLPIDENHAIDLAAPAGGSSPARGWIVELQSRADGVWGRVEWTGPGQRIMAHKEYRGVSPVITHGKDGTISAILRASLTNTPNLIGLTSLHSQEGDVRTKLKAAVGGVATGGDDAIIAGLLRRLLDDQDATIRPALAAALGEAFAQGEPQQIAAAVIRQLSPMPVSYVAVLDSLALLKTKGWRAC